MSVWSSRYSWILLICSFPRRLSALLSPAKSFGTSRKKASGPWWTCAPVLEHTTRWRVIYWGCNVEAACRLRLDAEETVAPGLTYNYMLAEVQQIIIECGPFWASGYPGGVGPSSWVLSPGSSLPRFLFVPLGWSWNCNIGETFWWSRSGASLTRSSAAWGCS